MNLSTTTGPHPQTGTGAEMTMEIADRCVIRYCGDETTCSTCTLTWDTNDSHPPRCPRVRPTKTRWEKVKGWFNRCKHHHTTRPFFVFDGDTGQGLSRCLDCGKDVWQGAIDAIRREGSKFGDYWIDPTGVMVHRINGHCDFCDCPGWTCAEPKGKCPRYDA